VTQVTQGGLLTSIYSCQTIYHAPVTQVTQGGLLTLMSVVLPVSPVSPVHDILFGSCILKSVVLPVSPVSPVHDILFGSCILKSVVLPVSPVSPDLLYTIYYSTVGILSNKLLFFNNVSVSWRHALTSIYSCQGIYHAPVTQVTQGGLLTSIYDILFGSCILKSVVLHVSPVSPVHDILFGSCILKSVVLPVSLVSPENYWLQYTLPRI
jgi:hypothetical protein